MAFATVMLWVVAFVSLVSFLLLIKCKDYVVGSFGDIGEATYGRWMRVAVLISITLSQVRPLKELKVPVCSPNSNTPRSLASYLELQVLLPKT